MDEDEVYHWGSGTGPDYSVQRVTHGWLWAVTSWTGEAIASGVRTTWPDAMAECRTWST